MNKKYIISIFAIIMVISILLFIFINFTKFSNLKSDYILIINNNDSANIVIEKISNNFSVNENMLKLFFRISGFDKEIKPGIYNLEPIDNIFELIHILTSKELFIEKDGYIIKQNDYIKFIIYEGWNIFDIAESLETHEQLNIDREKFINKCNDTDFINSLNIEFNIFTLEGLLYPDTYYLMEYYNEEDIISIFINEFKEKFNLINMENSHSNLTYYERIVLASIIQSEAKHINEMPYISSVFINRLNLDMKLDADPTILYCMTLNNDENNYREFLGSRKSVKLFSKYKNNPNCIYNTYINKGLPPAPICNPGYDAIYSAFNPINTTYKYFVANDSGLHFFSTTYREHINKVNGLKNTK